MRLSLLQEMSFNIMALGCFLLIFILISVPSQTSISFSCKNYVQNILYCMVSLEIAQK